MRSTICNTCIHYRQHYTLDGEKLFRINCGHCACIERKSWKLCSKACESYVPGESIENSFVSREYLSKTLLKRVLEMEFLPQIESLDCKK